MKNRCIKPLLVLSFSLLSTGALAQSAKSASPDLSVNLLGLLRYGDSLSSDRLDHGAQGHALQGAEIQMTSDVDPYFRAAAVFALHPEEGEFHFDVEELYFESLSINALTLKGGKFKAAFGKHNPLHTHAYPFVDAPLTNEIIFGEEGLNEVGLSASALLPIASWFSELTVQLLNASNEELFDSPNSADVAALARWKNLWDFGASTTLEFGLSALTGKNKALEKSEAWGADLTLKWRPTMGGKYRSLAWTSEYIGARRSDWIDAESGRSAEDLGGITTALQYQLAERWSVGSRYERRGIPTSGGYPMITKVDALLGFFPSEFSGFRLQYTYARPHAGDAENSVALQYNLSFGAHPAHAY